MPRVNLTEDYCRTVGPRVRQFRLQKGWTQKKLSEASRVSLRTLKSLENGAVFSPTTLRKLAAALEIDVERLDDSGDAVSEDDLPGFLVQKAFPDLGDAIAQLTRDGALADMRGDFEHAVESFQSASEQYENAIDSQAQLIIRWAISMDNAGRNEEAINDLRPLLVNEKWQQLRPQITDWVKYHIAIAQRRVVEKEKDESKWDVKQLHRIARQFRELVKNGDEKIQVGATHQLGVIHMLLYRQSGDQKEKARAVRHYRKSRKAWKENQNFREGYSLRRLAELSAREGEWKAAHSMLLDALEVFSVNRAERYRRETRDALTALLDAMHDHSKQTSV